MINGHKSERFIWVPSIYLYNKTRHSYIYMLRIAGQTAGPIWLKFVLDTHGW